MNGLLTSLAAVALVPAMTGVPPEQAGRTITVTLCTGGTMSIPIDGQAPAKGVAPCCAKGCRSRRKSKASQSPD
ncbi:hypothetical protein [Croceicoccus gelatinilyticus]|uniref:hypothetical protein n=1 Tax=Croceicoccus gelatinilyticus TaxID=2835536 RepID=UPI001BD0084B|nr:hypothetical protein [Croceicoccus gelatinilyticus]MBS7670718.1 hypothetical protein [Croceicoccus gelatinilyticus]